MCSEDNVQPSDLTSPELDVTKLEEIIISSLEEEPQLKASFASPALGGFAAPIAAKIATGILKGQNLQSVKQSVIEDVKAMASERMQDLANEAGARLNTMAAEATKGTFNVGKSSVPGSGSDGPPKGGQRGGSGQTPFNYGLLNMNPVPVKLNLTTPIVPNCYPDYFLESNPKRETRLHIVGYDCNPFSTLKTQYLDRFMSMLLTKVQVYAQNSVKFRISLTTFSAAQIKEYFTALTDALLLFYYYTAVLEYCKPEYKHANEGMFVLRDSLSPTDLEAIYELSRYLELFPIPPRLNEYCWYLMQNYKASENPGSALIRFCPFSWGISEGTTFDPATISFDSISMDIALSRLISTDNKRVAEVFAVAAPTWLKTNVVGSSGATLFSPNFNTIFGNSSLVSDSQRVPSVNSVDQEFSYAVWGGRLDGLAYAMCSAWDTSQNEWIPALGKPMPSFTEGGGKTFNRFYYNGETRVFEVPFYDTVPILVSGLYTNYTVTPTQNISAAPATAEYRRGVTGRTISDSAAQVLEWLLSFETMGSAMSDLPSKSNKRYNKRSRTSVDLKE